MVCSTYLLPLICSKSPLTPNLLHPGDDDDFGLGGNLQSQLNIVRLPTCISSLYKARPVFLLSSIFFRGCA